jgi:putative ATPase
MSTENKNTHVPLPEKLRPQSFDALEGISEGLKKELIQIAANAKSGVIPSLLLWGPPGCGKTTIAKLFGQETKANFIQISAVLSGVKEIREVVESAKKAAGPTILFVDEIHRFSKSQQDAFLPHVEQGLFSLIGATTENPSFYVTRALLSRMRVIALQSLSHNALQEVLSRGLSMLEVTITEDARETILAAAMGDARKLLSYLESAVISRQESKRFDQVTKEELTTLLATNPLAYDKSGDMHYDLISAFIKSLRGSDPDAALYYGFRILESGEDPRFLIRRMIAFASEDVGNADINALGLVVNTLHAFEAIGMPEGKIPIAQCITYLASVPKSNRSYEAMHAALDAIKRYPDALVPMHIRNAPTKVLKDIGAGRGYEYPHDFPGGVVPGATYMPLVLQGETFYKPKEVGLEGKIKSRLDEVRKIRSNA